MIRILLDVNVILDVLLNRKPHVDASSVAWTAVETGRAQGFLSAHAVTTVHFLNAKAAGGRVARSTTRALLSVFDVAVVDEAVMRSAVALRFRDFEDAVTAAAAERARCSAIVTRNAGDFRKSPVRTLTPLEAAAWLGMSGG
jgi:predicted nucleic acid-binding protein